MEIEQFISLRMVGAVISLLLILQLPGIFASGFVLQLKVCGADHLAYSNSNDLELYYINGNLVDKVSFCKALQFHYANHCDFKAYFRSDYCGLDLLLDETPFKGGRKILQKVVGEDPKTRDINHPGSRWNSGPKKVGLVAGGILVMSCALICPCIYKRRKATSHAVLSKDLNSTDSVSPFDVNSSSEKIPPSPARVPPSPLRVPPSPSIFTMSPKLSRIGSIHLTMNQALRATRNFSSSLRIGEGGFGVVYKAQLEDGQVVAIKRAKKEDFANLQTEFCSEVELLSKIDHRNLVKLLGFVDKGNERLIITEFVPNGTLREHLDGQHGKILDFNQRLEIAIDVAHGLTYLHLYAGHDAILNDAFKKFDEGNLLDMVDPSMNEAVEKETLMNMFGLAFQCAAPIRNDRPDMKAVGEQLWAVRADYLKKSLKK
ncbi:hypothetical protein EZV62_013248 [Acer yangbiense]|uniref:Protein kinase domain-containing protein n=1 Tax=Acer yangbiense TaxID=1000413 RepID=A0A5C7HYF0_9ROSI|nr:hypothetical protein EZV62_013248 [Acer yangbiense]